MPNWTTNVLTIEGDNDNIQDFIKRVQTEEQEMPHIFENLLPCPQELKDTVSGWTPDEDVQSEREKQYKANEQKYGYKDWYVMVLMAWRSMFWVAKTT